MDAVCDRDEVLIPGILEEVERAGIHSGDSFAVYPTRTLTQSTLDHVVRDTTVIARRFGIAGLLNVQFVIQNGVPHVLEVNANCYLEQSGEYATAAAADGLDYPALINRIAELAVERHKK